MLATCFIGSIYYFDPFAKSYYSSPDPQERNRAHQFLITYFDQDLTIDKLIEFKHIMEHSTSSYPIILASNALVNVFTRYFATLYFPIFRKWSHVTSDFRRNLYEYLIEHIVRILRISP